VLELRIDRRRTSWATDRHRSFRSLDTWQLKLNAVAHGIVDLMWITAGDYPEMLQDRQELLRAVGLENRESA
jgi:hypothetical protein